MLILLKVPANKRWTIGRNGYLFGGTVATEDQNLLWQVKFFYPNSHAGCQLHVFIGLTRLIIQLLVQQLWQRNNEMQVSGFILGVTLILRARALIVTQYGTRSQVVPRNDYSPIQRAISFSWCLPLFSWSKCRLSLQKNGMVSMLTLVCSCHISAWTLIIRLKTWEYRASFTSDNTLGF